MTSSRAFLAPHVQTFFTQHLCQHKQASPQTIASDRDTFRPFLTVVKATTGREPAALQVSDLDAPLELQFLDYLEHRRGNTVRARNMHLAAIRTFIRFLALRAPESLATATRHELHVQITLAVALMNTKGFAAPDVEQAYARARELCEQVGETSERFAIVKGLQSFYLVRGALQTARDLSRQLLDLAQRLRDSDFLLLAHQALGDTLFWLGELVPARAQLERGISLYDAGQHQMYAVQYGEDPGVVCLIYASLTLWGLGYADQALHRIDEALALAQKLAHPFSLAFALLFAARLHQLRREAQLAQERAEAVMALSAEHRFAHWLARATLLRGWAMVERGQRELGLAEFRQGMVMWQAVGIRLGSPQALAGLAEAYMHMGQVEDGLRVLTEALAATQAQDERVYEAELYRLQGELLLRRAKPAMPEAEARMHQALEVARRQQAKALELRATMSLSRLWQQQGKCSEAQRLLATIYGWFTEGFDTADLQEAKALLQELS